MMKRRDFITLLGGAAAMGPLAARAQQQPAMPVIGFLHAASPQPYAHLVDAFRQGLKEMGYIEGENLTIEYRWAEGRFDRLPALAADLVQRHVRLIAALGGSAPPLAAQRTTATIPIVFSSGEVDPVKSGLVASLNRPGGNVTGVSPMTGLLTAKRLEQLHEMVPNAVIGYLANSDNPNFATHSSDVHEAARVLGLALHAQSVSSDRDFESAFDALVQRGIGALLVGVDPFFFARREQIIALAARHSLPASYSSREFVAAGGLISYAASFVDGYRLAGIYSSRILHGEKPADLPVVQSVKFELAINLNTAKALRLTVPPTLLARVDEVIE
jgi:putative tryptophan/tyrosine transport system substrate-binding protein